MRKFICLCLMAFCVAGGYAQMTSKIDPRFELTSIAFRLAGAQEYAQCGVPGYARDIDNHFLQYAEHPLISFIQQIRNDYGIGYNAVSSTADWLMIKNGKVKLQPGYHASDVVKADSRWTEPVFKRYLKLLDDFYRKSKFQQFYDEHHDLYRFAEGQLDSLLTKVDADWFDRYYGKEFGAPDIYIGLCNGPSNYALTAETRKSGYGIVVGCGCDNQGQPFYHPLFFSIVLHEFAHNYSNPLLMQYWSQMEDAANVIYPHVAQQMAQNAYGDAQTTIGEWFNDLCVLMFYRELQPEWLGYMTTSNQESGFIWMGRSVKFMDEFYANREFYLHISDFMPRLVEFIGETAKDIDKIEEEFRNNHPYVTEVSPVLGSVVSIDAAPVEVTVRFSEPMAGGYGANWIDRADVTAIPLVEGCFWRDEYTLVYPLKADAFERGKIYGIKLLGWAIRSKKGYTLSDDFEVIFKVE